MRILEEMPVRDIRFRNLIFEDSPVRLASCQRVLFDGCTFEKKENREVGARDAEGNKVLRHIWFRGCNFLA